MGTPSNQVSFPSRQKELIGQATGPTHTYKAEYMVKGSPLLALCFRTIAHNMTEKAGVTYGNEDITNKTPILDLTK